jgi:hypothetical protein
MISIRVLQEQLLADHGIRSEWVESGGGQKCLLVKIGDATEHGGFLCVDCVYHSEGIAESDAPTHNDYGTRFLQNLDDQNMTAVLAGEVHDFSRARCVGCLTTLAGYRFPVVLFDKNPDN